MTGRVHLVIPDSHCEPGVNNDRYEWLGKLIVDLKPDVVVNLGDHADMASLCSYDAGKKGFEGRRYKRDVEHVHDSLERLHGPIVAYQRRQRKGAKGWNPEFHYCEGNHEDRISRAVENDAKLEGTISLDDLKFQDFGWRVHRFKKPVILDGISYCHLFSSGVMGRPIGGEHAAHSLVTKLHTSATVGHSHLRDFSERTRPDGTRVLGLVAGCYFEHESGFAGPANALYWRGVVVKREVHKGAYEHQWLSLSSIKREYGS